MYRVFYDKDFYGKDFMYKFFLFKDVLSFLMLQGATRQEGTGHAQTGGGRWRLGAVEGKGKDEKLGFA